MANLASRIDALEKTAPAPDAVKVIVRFVVEPGQCAVELSALRDLRGNQWERQPGEPEHAFIERAARESRTSPDCLAVLVAD